MVALPSYSVGNALNFQPVQNALTQVTAQNNANRQYGLEQQASARADESLGLQKQQVASSLKSAALDQEKTYAQLTGGWAQTALDSKDPATIQKTWDGIKASHPEFSARLQQHGIDPNDPVGGLSFITAEARGYQNPLDVKLREAQIAQAQTSTAAARAPTPVVVGTDVFGSKYANRNPLTGDLTPLDEKITGGGQGTEIVKNLSDGIVTGKTPPVLTGYGNSKIGPAVKADLARRGFDLTKASLEYEAAHKQVLALNGPQMVRYTGLAQSVVNTIDRVKELSAQMSNSGITGLNAAKLTTLINTAGNTDQGKLASQYLAAVNTLKEEFANLAQGGYAPTEAAWDLANKQINANFGVDQLPATLDEVQRLIRYRLDAIPNIHTLGPGAANPYVNGGVAPQVGHGGSQPAAAPPQAAPAPQQADVDPRTVPPGQTFSYRGHTLKALGNGQFEQVQ